MNQSNSDDLTKAQRESMGRGIDSGTIAVVSGTTPAPSAPGPDGAPQWFGPGKPLNPVAPDSVAGRQLDFPTHYNLAQRPRSYEGISFEQLRAFGDSYDLLRLIIETRKDQIESFTWTLKAKEGKTVSEDVIKEVQDFFQYPDKEHPWGTWLRMLIEDVLVIDTACIYPRMTRGGDLYSLDLMDGATIKRVIDAGGRTPLPPDPAYQQVLKGLPAVDYTREDLIYWMRNPRTSKLYGYSPVEQVIMTVNIAMRRQIHQLQFYTEGSMPEGISGVPDGWTMETIKQFQTWWDSMMEGNTAQRRHMKFVPFDPSKMAFPKAEVMKDMFDEWLARIICFAFSISPTALIKETNRATAESVQDAAKAEGLIPLLNWTKSLLDFLLQRVCGQEDLEWAWDAEKNIPPLDAAKIFDIYLKGKVMTVDEVREELGRDPLTQEQKDELNPPQPAPPTGKVDPLTGLPYKEPVPPKHPDSPPTEPATPPSTEPPPPKEAQS